MLTLKQSSRAVAARDKEVLLRAMKAILCRMYDLGAAPSLGKCFFFVQQLEWCGVEINLATDEWRMDPVGTRSLRLSSQTWTAQIKETYAQRWALYHVAWRYFRYAMDIILLCDNRNLATTGGSADPRITRWQEDIRVYGGVRRGWIPGDWNSIADYASRVVAADPAAELTEEQQHELYVQRLRVEAATPAERHIVRSAELRLAGLLAMGKSSTSRRTRLRGPEEEVIAVRAARVTRSSAAALRAAVEDEKRRADGAAASDQRPARAKRVTFADELPAATPVEVAAAAPVEAPAAVAEVAVAEPRRADAEAVVAPGPGGGGVLDAAAAATTGRRRRRRRRGGQAESPVEVAPLPEASIPLEMEEGPDGQVVVPGHVVMSPLLAEIVKLQGLAPAAERESWKGKGYTETDVAGHSVHLFRGHAIVPRDADALKQQLLRMAHDRQYHLPGTDRTLQTLQRQAKVHWEGMAADVLGYIKSCVRCTLATDHGPLKKGTLAFTHSPKPHFTWYVDFKGPMPFGSGYLMAVVDAFSRHTRLRYLKSIDAETVIRELEIVIGLNGTSPVVLRCDNGPPFNSAVFADWCMANAIRLVPGVPHHSQGQGIVETKFRGIAHALMATLGRKAPREWWTGPHLQMVELFLNSLVCEPMGCSPHCVLFGEEPRSALSAADWTTPNFGSLIEVEQFTYEMLTNAVFEGHEQMRNVQGLAMLGSSVSQVLTKHAYDASALPNDFKVGDVVAMFRVATNRMEPHYTGPLVITRLESRGNMAYMRPVFGGPGELTKPVHVSRLIHFDLSRATSEDVATALVEPGDYVVKEVLDHRVLADGTLEFHLSWYDSVHRTWEPAAHLVKIKRVQDYCLEHGLELVAPPPPVLGRGGRRAARKGR